MPPISRRSLLVAGTALVGAATIPSAVPAFALARPIGPEYIGYEKLYRSGDSVGAALQRLSEPKIVTFPEGRFECSDFNSGYLAGINVPAICRGIVGSGRGTLGGSTGTVFTMKPHSSTKGGGSRDTSGNLYVPVQDNHTPCQLGVVKQLNQRAPSVWRHFQIAGTEQGHLFSAFQVYGTAGRNRFENILISGWDGDSGAPPGETCGLSVNGPGAHHLAGVEVDGRRAVGGEVFGAMGITVQNSVGVTMDSCKASHTRAAGFVAFQSVNGTMTNCVSDARVPTDKIVGNGSINFERTAGWRLINFRITGRDRKVHITHSNDNWVLRSNGTTYPVANGDLTIVSPTYNDLWGNDYLMIQSWTPYWNGDTMSTPPLVVKSDGRTKIPYAWIHYKSQLVD